MNDGFLTTYARLTHLLLPVLASRNIQRSTLQVKGSNSLQGVSDCINLRVKVNRIVVHPKLLLQRMRFQLVDSDGYQFVTDVNRCRVSILVERRAIVGDCQEVVQPFLVSVHVALRW